MWNACNETSIFKVHIFLTITFSTTSATTYLNMYNSVVLKRMTIFIP